MKKNYTPQWYAFLFCCLLSLFSFNSIAQVGIGTTTPNPNALLELDATTTPGGLLLPRVSLSSTDSFAPMTTHVAGMTVYNTVVAGISPNDVVPGYYYNDGSKWVRIAAASVPSSDWTVTGNSGLNVNNNFLGTTDGVNLRFRTSNANAFEISSGDATNRGKLRAMTDGTVALPVYSFSNSTAAGMYLSGTNTVAFSTTATERMRLLANGQIIINNTGAPFAGDRFTVQGANNEYAINGYATGASGVSIYGENKTAGGVGVFGNVDAGFGVWGQSTGSGWSIVGDNTGTGKGVIGFSVNSGVGVQGQNNSNGVGIFGSNTGAGPGIQAVNSSTGDALEVFQTGVGDGIYNYVTKGDGIWNYMTDGSAIYNTILSNKIAIISDLTTAGGFGEFIDFDNKNGIGVIVDANPAGTGGDVWGFIATVKTNTAMSGLNTYGGILAGDQYGKGHSILMNHRGATGRNVEFNTLGTTNPEANIHAISFNRAPTIMAQNQNTANSAGIITVADISYTGTQQSDHIAISGTSTPSNGYGIGVQGTGAHYGVHGIKSGNANNGFGVYATGRLGASGTKTFIIDDPRNPENNYLLHSSIESNEVLNLYRGTATFNANGSVVVQLPDYYDVINKNPSYQLTPVGAAMPNLHIEKEVANGKFAIAGGVPGKKVSWILTAERNDPYMKQNPDVRDVVVDKGADRGKYLMPELYGKPKEMRIAFYESEKAVMSEVVKTNAPDLKKEKNEAPQFKAADYPKRINTKDEGKEKASSQETPAPSDNIDTKD